MVSKRTDFRLSDRKHKNMPSRILNESSTLISNSFLEKALNNLPIAGTKGLFQIRLGVSSITIRIE